MCQLCFGAVTFAVLGVFGGYLDIDVTEEPPIAETFGKVDSSETPALAGRASNAETAIRHEFFQRLRYLECVSLHRKGLLALQHVKGASRVLVFHPMTVNALVFFGMALHTPVSFQVDRRLMVSPTPVGTLGTPLAAVDFQTPTFS